MNQKIEKLKKKLILVEEAIEKDKKLLNYANCDQVDKLLADLSQNAIKLGFIEMELKAQEEKFWKKLGIKKELSLTLPKEVWQRLEYEVEQFPNTSLELLIREVLIHEFFPLGVKNESE